MSMYNSQQNIMFCFFDLARIEQYQKGLSTSMGWYLQEPYFARKRVERTVYGRMQRVSYRISMHDLIDWLSVLSESKTMEDDRCTISSPTSPDLTAPSAMPPAKAAHSLSRRPLLSLVFDTDTAMCLTTDWTGCENGSFASGLWSLECRRVKRARLKDCKTIYGPIVSCGECGRVRVSLRCCMSAESCSFDVLRLLPVFRTAVLQRLCRSHAHVMLLGYMTRCSSDVLTPTLQSSSAAATDLI
ncbi:hypothetical protein BU25DRAFT_260340 [Macroventuria anomochaeta]|uniref:Uncharacterized protein n=1 Tax=Macroventuria anomochaeta TaxID=301207 RepID=A0ACB6S766_9PLEO|nr:uncharacterized protein BU25DRAFT_260340 [Macroventuria anomochaeta]KAF2629883.1 hypothetical protein BU25DRAFT_260340 [Macroventuria anomochaeta]